MAGWILINYVPFFMLVGLIAVGLFTQWWVAVLMLYLLPPLLARTIIVFAGEPQIKERVPSRGSYVWWITTQLQVPFMRFGFLEEILRMVPGLYSGWLRLWGAKVGAFVFWSPTSLIADRPFVQIGDRVVFGYGAKVSSHLLVKEKRGNGFSLVFAAPKIGDGVILGTLSAVAPGAEIEAGETLTAASALPPFHKIKGKKIYNPSGIETTTSLIVTHEEA